MTDSRLTPHNRRHAHIHYVVAFIGGFLGLYPFLTVAGIFGSAQTSNLIETLTACLEAQWHLAGYHFIGICLYMLGIGLATFIPAHCKINVKIISLFVDFVAAMFMCFMPEDLPGIFYLYPTFFAMSFQWTSFSGSYGFVSSTIFSTNNLRQFTSSLVEVYLNHRPEFGLKAKFYGATLFAFHLGIAECFLMWKIVGNMAFVFTFFPVVVAVHMVVSADHADRDAEFAEKESEICNHSNGAGE